LRVCQQAFKRWTRRCLADITFNVILTITNAIRKNLPSSGLKMASNYDVHSSPPPVL
jgi:hypothetical protein